MVVYEAFGGEAVLSESIYKAFRRENKSITAWLSLTKLNLQWGLRNETAKLERTPRHAQQLNSTAKTCSSEKRARGRDLSVCQPKHEGEF